MIYFAYGSNMFTYRLEKRVGNTKLIGLGQLRKYKFEFSKLSKDGSLKASILYTGSDEDFVLGILFDISDARKHDLDKAEGLGSGYDIEIVKVEVKLSESIELLDAFTYIVTPSERALTGKPYDWYVKLIVAGAQEHSLDTTYISKIKSTDSEKDPMQGREDTALFILKEATFFRKHLGFSIELLNELNKSKEYIISLPGHVLDNRKIFLKKGSNEFVFQTDSQFIPGPQTHKELNVAKKTLIFNEPANHWLVEGKYFLIKHLEYNFEEKLKLITGSITNISSCPVIDFNDKFFRLAMPIKDALKIQDYEFVPFTRDFSLGNGMLDIIIDGKQFHFYSVKSGDRYFLVIDCLEISKLQAFQIACNTILMTYSFLSGNCNSGDAYCLSFDNVSMEIPTGINFYALGTFAPDLNPLFTTNRYFGLNIEAFKDDTTAITTPEGRKKQYPDMPLFPTQVFENICQFAFEDDKVLQTLNLLMNYHVDSLEMKLSMQYVTLETITTALDSGPKNLKPIQDKTVAKDLIKRLKSEVDLFAAEHGIAIKSLTPIYSTLENINKPTNSDKLTKTFDLLGYTLSQEERTIISYRNRFLHGNVISFGEIYEDYKELLHISFRMHFLIGVLLLKKAGFTGRLINYAKAYEYITGKDLNEEVFKMI